MHIEMRHIEEKDINVLWKIQYYAALLDMEDRPVADIQQHPSSVYVVNWGRKGDFGFVAITDDEEIIGAAWCRLFSEEEKGFGFIDSKTPELSIAVSPEYRGIGIGSKLLVEIINYYTNLQVSISLAVRSTNPAFQLYRKHGFRRLTNRDFLNLTGITSYVMVHDA